MSASAFDTGRLPTISVVTASLNRGYLIEQAIQSVLTQAYPSLEHIIVDGGSSDDTLPRLTRYPHLRVVCEPDQGVYDAFNKGVRLATGDVISFLNSDDLLPDGVLLDVGRAFAENEGVDMVCGKALVFRETEEGKRVVRAVTREPAAPRLTLGNFLWRTPMLNARFLAKRVYVGAPPFDLDFHVESDFDFLLSLARTRIRSVYLDEVVYQYRQHAGSLSFGDDRSAFWPERLSILEKHFKDPQLTLRERRVLQRWNSWLVANAMSARLLHGGGMPVADSFPRGLRRDWLFIPRAIGYALSRVGRLWQSSQRGGGSPQPEHDTYLGTR